MKWPWTKAEKREAGGSYTDSIIAAIEAQASATVADVSGTAAIEAVTGLLSRTLAGAEVVGPDWVQRAVNPVWLGQVGRDLLRIGEHASVLNVRPDGSVALVPAGFINFETQNQPDDADEETWIARLTCYGPSTSVTRLLPRTGFVYTRWGTSPGVRYRGRSPMGWASLTARLQGEAERSLADESAGPLAQLLAIPQDGGADSDDDPLKLLRADIKGARGRALLVETVAAAWGEGRQAAPSQDWKPSRLGPNMPDSMVTVADSAFNRMVAACGASPALFDDSDGTSKREALRQWHMGTVVPLAKILAHELTMRFETEVKIDFDNYAMDMVSRAQVVSKLSQAGVELATALAAVGLGEQS